MVRTIEALYLFKFYLFIDAQSPLKMAAWTHLSWDFNPPTFLYAAARQEVPYCWLDTGCQVLALANALGLPGPFAFSAELIFANLIGVYFPEYIPS
jgi:hypothetical protein